MPKLSHTPIPMNKYIQDSIRNTSRSVVKGLTVPQKKATLEMLRGLYTCGEPILRHMAQNDEISVKKQAEKYSYHLGKVNLKTPVEDLAIRRAKQSMKKDSIIAYDLGDISKEHAKKMERITEIYDSSEKKTVNGHVLHGVGVNNFLLKMQIHNDDKFFRNQTRKEIIENISKKLGNKGIWAFDRGNDDKQFLKYLRQKEDMRFVLRIKKNRHVCDVKTGTISKVEHLSPGEYLIHLMHNGKLIVSENYRLTIKHHLKDKEPIRIISNLSAHKYCSKQVVDIYLQRWGIENLYKRAKQKFSLEKIRVLKFKKCENLITLIQLAMIIATVIYRNIQKLTNTLVAPLILAYKTFIKLKNLTFNLDSFITYLQSSVPKVTYKPPPKSPQLSLFKKLGSF
jgi:hypothetical protein